MYVCDKYTDTVQEKTFSAKPKFLEQSNKRSWHWHKNLVFSGHTCHMLYSWRHTTSAYKLICRKFTLYFVFAIFIL